MQAVPSAVDFLTAKIYTNLMQRKQRKKLKQKLLNSPQYC